LIQFLLKVKCTLLKALNACREFLYTLVMQAQVLNCYYAIAVLYVFIFWLNIVCTAENTHSEDAINCSGK